MTTFSKKLLSFKDTKSFSRIVVDYLDGELDKSFFSTEFSENSLSKAIQLRQNKPVNRQQLHAVVQEQYQKLSSEISNSATVKKNIDSLKELKSFTVTTGHQLNLFTGPLYFIYKIVTTINLSARLGELYPDYHFIPVYWLASEDHDLEEINHIYIFGKKVEWNPSSSGAAGKIIPAGISSSIEELKILLGNNPDAEKIINLFLKAYNDHHNLSEATRIIVHELFSDSGLVIVDGNDARLKKLFLEEMKDDAVNQSAFRLVNETIAELEKKYKSQVRPREINLFYLEDQSRKRLIRKGEQFEVLETGRTFSREELFNEMNQYPERFSPNVVLRPLYQEKILPNIAYIGGPAEISYWLEYKSMFSHYGADLPLLVLRNCVTVIDKVNSDKLQKLGFAPEDIFLTEEELIKKYLKDNQSGAFSIEAMLNQTDALFQKAQNEVAEIDPTLKASVEAEKQKIQNSFRILEEKIRRAEKKKHDTAISQIKKIKEKLFPGNMLQERHENFLSFYSKYGDDFLKMLMMNLNPFEKKFILLVEE
jgi:bacillithiol biosynthesis cysteine-adding enzyme BshC